MKVLSLAYRYYTDNQNTRINFEVWKIYSFFQSLRHWVHSGQVNVEVTNSKQFTPKLLVATYCGLNAQHKHPNRFRSDGTRTPKRKRK